VPAPTRVQSVAIPFQLNAGSAVTSASFNVQTGDVLTIRASTEDAANTLALTDNSGGAITWTLRRTDTTAGHAAIYLWTATIVSNITGLTYTLTCNVAGKAWGGRCTTWRGSAGVGVSNLALGTTAPSLVLTGCAANSAVDASCADWNAGAATATWGGTPTPTSEDATQVSGLSTSYRAYYADTGAAGNQTISMASVPTGAATTIVAVEILGGTGGPAIITTKYPPQRLRGPVQMVTRRRRQPRPVIVVAGQVFVNLGIVDEVDTPQAISRTKQRTLGLVTETDTPQGITRVKQKTLGLVTETDTPQAITRAHAHTLGLVTETDSPQPVGRTKSKTLGLVTETDTALPISISHGITNVNLGLVTETDTAQTIKRVKQRTFGLATETDQALNLTHRKQRTLSLLVETDTSQPITRQKFKTLGLLTTSNTALPVTRTKSRTLGLVVETDTPQHITVLTGIRRIGLGLVTELDTVRPLEPPLRIYPTPTIRTRYYIQRMGHSVRRRRG
jgi:hypothetical protein